MEEKSISFGSSLSPGMVIRIENMTHLNII